MLLKRWQAGDSGWLTARRAFGSQCSAPSSPAPNPPTAKTSGGEPPTLPNGQVHGLDSRKFSSIVLVFSTTCKKNRAANAPRCPGPQ